MKASTETVEDVITEGREEEVTLPKIDFEVVMSAALIGLATIRALDRGPASLSNALVPHTLRPDIFTLHAATLGGLKPFVDILSKVVEHDATGAIYYGRLINAALREVPPAHAEAYRAVTGWDGGK